MCHTRFYTHNFKYGVFVFSTRKAYIPVAKLVRLQKQRNDRIGRVDKIVKPCEIFFKLFKKER